MRLIDADALITFMRKGWRTFPSSELRHTCDITDIENAPTVDAEPVNHGHWINANEGLWNTVEVLKCSVCGEIDNRMYRSDAYCPNCGAKMDEVTE